MSDPTTNRSPSTTPTPDDPDASRRARRASVYLTAGTLDRLRLPPRDSPGDASLSGRLNGIVARYELLIDHAMPDFRPDEWCAIFDANNGMLADADPLHMVSPTMIWANVHDTPGLAEKWDVDPADIIDRLRRLTPAQSVAVIEAIQRFWMNSHTPTPDALHIAGVLTRRCNRDELEGL